VFGSDSFSGNPLAVVYDAEGSTTDEMLAITRWMNLSETAFLVPPDNDVADYRVRIFTSGMLASTSSSFRCGQPFDVGRVQPLADALTAVG
jgi:hypothetical protein